MEITGINLASKPKGKCNTIDNEQRHRIVCNYQGNMTIKKNSLYESLPTSTVYKILNKFRKTTSFVKLEQGGKKYEK